MVYRTRINYTAKMKAEIWDRWQRGESLNSIGQLFVHAILSFRFILILLKNS